MFWFMLFLAFVALLCFGDGARRSTAPSLYFIPSPTKAELRWKRAERITKITLFLAALWVWALWMDGKF